jgi:hypothetical protein
VALDQEKWLTRCESNKIDGVLYTKELVPNIPIQYQAIHKTCGKYYLNTGHDRKIICLSLDLDFSQEYLWFVARQFAGNRLNDNEYLVLLSELQLNEALIRDIIE